MLRILNSGCTYTISRTDTCAEATGEVQKLLSRSLEKSPMYNYEKRALQILNRGYGVATISSLLKIIGLFCRI